MDYATMLPLATEAFKGELAALTEAGFERAEVYPAGGGLLHLAVWFGEDAILIGDCDEGYVAFPRQHPECWVAIYIERLAQGDDNGQESFALTVSADCTIPSMVEAVKDAARMHLGGEAPAFLNSDFPTREEYAS